MNVYVNDRNEIKEVYTTTDETLSELEITDGTFDGWSEAKICCYKVEVTDGIVTMMTLYVSDKIVATLDNMSQAEGKNASDIIYLSAMTGVEL